MNDLATLLAHAMKRPLVKGHLRPRRIHLRGNPKWTPLFPALKEIGIDVVIKTDLPKVEEALGEFLAEVKEASSVAKVKATTEQAKVEKLFPPSPGTFVVTATLRSETRRASALW